MAGECDTALALLREAESRHPERDLNFQIAMTYEKCGDPDKAVEYYRRALSEDSGAQVADIREFIANRLREFES